MLEGELAERELAALHDELFRLAHRGRFQVVLDLGGVTHLDYRGIRPLIIGAAFWLWLWAVLVLVLA